MWLTTRRPRAEPGYLTVLIANPPPPVADPLMVPAAAGAGVGRVDRITREPAHRPGHGKPDLAVALRSRNRSNAEQLRKMAAVASELLDWLATESSAGVGIKQMHRLIMNSAYKMAWLLSLWTGLRPDHLLVEIPLRRLEGEAVRDVIPSQRSDQLRPEGRSFLDRKLCGRGIGWRAGLDPRRALHLASQLYVY